MSQQGQQRNDRDFRQSQFATEGGSNFLTAERTAKAETGSDEGLWGPKVHEGINKSGDASGFSGTAGISERDRDLRGSTFATEGGSNFLTAERTAKQEGKDVSGIWGPPVHHQGQRQDESKPEWK